MVLSQRAKAKRKKIRIERKWSNLYECKMCGNKLDSSDKHHILCNKCWNKKHPFEAMINRKKSGKY